jgi:stage III sporulation protein AF
MQFLINWVRKIILIILLAHFIEMLLPDNDLKKYVEVVIGFFLILVLLTPILRLSGRRISQLEFNLTPSAQPSFAQIVQTGKNLRRQQMEETQGDYKQKLSNQVEAVARLNARITNPQVEIELDSQNNLRQITIKAVSQNRSDSASTTDDNGDQSQALAEELREIIATFYGLSPSQVTVILN